LTTKDEIRKFLITYADRPSSILIEITGSHTEREIFFNNDANGNRTEQTREKTIVDFRYQLDLSPYIQPMGQINADAAIDGYLASKNKLRQIINEKIVNFDIAGFKSLVMERLRQLGYVGYFSSHRVDVNLKYFPGHVKVQDSSSLSVCLRNPMTDCLCILSCLCVCYYPIKYCYEANFRFQTQYGSSVDANTFFRQHENNIHGGARFGFNNFVVNIAL